MADLEDELMGDGSWMLKNQSQRTSQSVCRETITTNKECQEEYAEQVTDYYLTSDHNVDNNEELFESSIE